jgi:uncharacterized protein (TIGR02757 family)
MWPPFFAVPYVIEDPSLIPNGPDLPRLAERLVLLRDEWHGRRLDSDPLVFAHAMRTPEDQEVVAFLSASLAFGRVASIQASIRRVLDALGASPARFLEGWHGEPIPGLARFRHRWVGRDDMKRFLLAVARARREHGSLRNLFAACDSARRHDRGEEDFVGALDLFYTELRALAGGPPFTRGLAFLLPEAGGGSACKRAHLFLRWMVRTGDPDLGLWNGSRFDAARLLLPMDTHVHRISTYLGLTERRSADLRAAREATSWLRRIDPDDPTAFDWALSRLGILAECVREKTRRHCERCVVRPVCRVSLVPPEEDVSAAMPQAAAAR